LLEDGSSPRPVITAPIRGRDVERAQAASRRAALALDVATILLLPALTIYLGLNAGGYFADTTGWAAAAVAIGLAVRFAVSGGPLARGGWSMALAAGGLAAFALWTLLSAVWSDTLGRAVVEFDRSLLYLLVLLVFASLERPRAALRWLPAGFALAAVFLCGVGLATRTIPELWAASPPADGEWLGYPVTYANGLGLLASLGLIACLHLASWERESALARVLASAALPALSATVAFTHSTGAVVAGAVGAILYAVLGRPRGLPTALLAATPFVILAVHEVQGAELLQRADPTTPAAADQGREVARTLGLVMLGSGGLLGLLLPAERRLMQGHLPRPPRRAVVAIGAVLTIGVAVGAATQLPDAVRAVGDEIEGRSSRAEAGGADRPKEAGVFSSQPRVDYWRVAFDAFEEEPLAGTGAGSFAERWARDRPIYGSSTEAHSLYVETLAELGIVGGALMAISVTTLLVTFVTLLRSQQRPIAAAALGLASAWLIHAGLDWDWELPVVTVWLFALGGCALAAARTSVGARPVVPVIRASGAIACLAAAVTPATIALSQSRLDGSADALLRGDCREAERLASSASTLLPPRAEPYELLAYCASRAGDDDRAIEMMEQALDRDPRSWKLYYGLALVRAAAGKDPRPAVQQAHTLNRREVLVIEATKRFVGSDPKRWRRQARASPLPLP
jgi:O-antigen ligase